MYLVITHSESALGTKLMKRRNWINQSQRFIIDTQSKLQIKTKFKALNEESPRIRNEEIKTHVVAERIVEAMETLEDLDPLT